ncbi:tryptophan synthase subunit alpha [Spirochaeta africana]|uniref:Tryptophan synthase alpha chain n=1 Tax=Spirochaeta africana (strain ATCC 700263 / DSM 8902 / Z-7692) TaxID=889378 RepID=H9UM34_SPIAZ|nr:tryptophan synthase subunit alpha [Spirochaeta africana]AFG38577.1 tryptophan synthase, alpha subunit [Spirochaeta africana DSM 8902]
MSKQLQVMAHMIPYYPDQETAEAAVAGLVAGGATHIEVQFPFSDPTADGPTIQAACSRALGQGFRVDEGFRFVRRAAAAHDVPVFIMSYASLVYARGVERFVQDARAAGVTGLIVPDLPVDADEGLYAAAGAAGLEVWPVVVPNTPPERIALIQEVKPRGVYAALRAGITGSRTEIGQDNLRFLDQLHDLGAPVFAGFGIRERDQVQALAPHVAGVVIGSAFVEIIADSTPQNVASRLEEFLRSLLR